jgi:CheY-like chemotaxis protein
VRGDATGLHQVLMNLAVNARDAMPAGGSLRLATANRVVKLDDPTAPADAQPGPYLEVMVHDTGVGMTPDVQQRIFDPFFTTKSAGQGTGLGLAVVYGIVKSHGGWVRVSSEPGWGSHFHIFLPAEPGAEVEEVEATAPVVPLNAGREAVLRQESPRTVLVVDDEELIRNLAKSVLERDGYKVMVAVDGPQAVEAYRKHGSEVAAVLLDYTMPEMTGVQVFAALREMDPDVRVIFSTGYAADHDGETLLASGACGFVPKPYRPAQLLDTMRMAVAH